MNAQIICVGTELLLGDVVNTNASNIAHLLAEMGIGVYKQVVVGDNPERLKKAMDEAFNECDIILFTGGLGPTYDDLTKQTIASWFKKKLVLNKEEEEILRGYYKKQNRIMTENNLQQVMLPEGCTVLKNPNGTAPGCIIEENGKIAVMMPGPPREMRPMLEGPVYDYLIKKTGETIQSKTLNFFGIGESNLEHMIRDEIEFMEDPTVASYAKPGECQLRITSRKPTVEECMESIEPVKEELKKKFSKYCYGEDYSSINEATAKILIENNLTISAAESLTGGLLSSRLVDIPGVSKTFLGSIVAYSNDVKINTLKVKKETIDKYSEVSKECAEEMAEGVRKLLNSDIGVSTTGYAGPDGNDVGLVFVCATNGKETLTKELHLARGRADDRDQIRLVSTSWAMRLALMLIDHNKELLEGGSFR